jgi:hypothetical protein
MPDIAGPHTSRRAEEVGDVSRRAVPGNG